jgi:multidrug efflux system membrane fusion protein
MTHEIPHETNSDVEQPSLPEPMAESTRHSTSPSRRIGLVLAGVLLATGGFFVMRSNAAKPDAQKNGSRAQIMPVMVATVMQKTVPVQIKAIGHVQAESTVSVTPEAGGRITGVYFKKGQEVHKGQLLFTLDNRSEAAAMQQAQGVVARDQAQVQQAKDTLAKDQALVRQAEATLAKDEAQAQYAQSESSRYNSLYQQGAISQEQTQQYATNSKAAAATIQADKEAIATAQVQVKGDEAAITNAEAVVTADQGSLNSTAVQSSYTRIYAPIDGRAGNILVTSGNVVQANSTNPLVVIEQIRPIQVAFSVPETELPEIQQHLQNGKLPVNVSFTGSNRTISGALSFVNNTVDNATGTIQLIGDFDNANDQLYPGQFVNTTLMLTEEPNATVVPDQAVQNGPNGQFVFVVRPDDTVENVPVVASSTIDGLDVIQKGVQPGQQVVTDGQANLVTGSKVRVKNSNANSDANSGSNGSFKNSSNDSDNAAPSASGDSPSNSAANPASNSSGQPRRHHHTANSDNSSNAGGNP